MFYVGHWDKRRSIGVITELLEKGLMCVQMLFNCSLSCQALCPEIVVVQCVTIRAILKRTRTLKLQLCGIVELLGKYQLPWKSERT